MAKAKPKTSSKLCVRCNRLLPLGDFYPNREWRSQMFRDAWCKDCVVDYCDDVDTLKEYCYDNNRKWDDAYWDRAIKKASYVLSGNQEYSDPSISSTRKEMLFNKAAVKQFFTLMNLTNVYCYTENIKNSGAEGYAPPKPVEEEAGPSMTYNKKWRGNFTAEQIEALEDIYSQYEEDFVLDNVNIRDYARKVAKASLNADIAEDRMRRGEISASEYKEAQKIFDDLSKSSNFAACRRKPGESSGLGSLGEIIQRLELSGALQMEGVTFPEDDIDRIIADFRHTLVAAGADGLLN